MMGAYIVVAVAFGWVLFRCLQVWQLARRANPDWLVTHYAQWQIVFCVAVSLLALSLSFYMVLFQQWQGGGLSHWWALFDVFVAFALLSMLGFFKKSLSAKRKRKRQ